MYTHPATPLVLGVYRLLMFLLAAGLGIVQLMQRGPIIFTFFTIWNWWCLTLFFLLATIASTRELLQQPETKHRRGGRKGHTSNNDEPADFLGKVIVSLYHIMVPVRICVLFFGLLLLNVCCC